MIESDDVEKMREEIAELKAENERLRFAAIGHHSAQEYEVLAAELRVAEEENARLTIIANVARADATILDWIEQYIKGEGWGSILIGNGIVCGCNADGMETSDDESWASNIRQAVLERMNQL